MASAPKEPVFRLYLVPELVDFYIDVPTTVALSLCLYPVKYLRYLGYCILGVDGRITRHKKPPSSSSSSPDSDGHDEPEEMPDSQTPLDAGEYYFAREDTGSQDGTQDGTEDGEEASQAGGAHSKYLCRSSHCVDFT